MDPGGKNRFRPCSRFACFIFGFLCICIVTAAVIFFSRNVNRIERRLGVLEAEKRKEVDTHIEVERNELFENAVKGLDEIMEKHNAEETADLFKSLTAAEGEGSLVEETGLRFRSDGEMLGTLFRNNRRYFRIKGHELQGEVEIESRADARLRLKEADTEGVAFVRKEREKIDEIFTRREKMRAVFDSLLDDRDTAALFEEKNLGFTSVVEDGFVLRRGIVNKGGAVIVRLALDSQNAEYRVDGNGTERVEKFKDMIAEVLEEYDPRAELRRTYEELKEIFIRMVEDEGFKDYLDERQIEIAEMPVTADRAGFVYRYPLKVHGGESIGALLLDPKDGIIALESSTREDPWIIERLPVRHGFSRGPEKVSETPAFLLVGTHQGLSDTIILVKPQGNVISMLSVPRDLYYNGQKINNLFRQLGPSEFKDLLEEILGVKVDYYITVDLEGFPKLVDALDTITVELEKELLDPNMHYSSNGQARMLFFSRGKHEIGGNAALALARSRSTTSDFSRARRQQLILKGILKRINQLNLSDAGSLYKILKTVTSYTDTDMSLNDILYFYRRYRDAKELRTVVLSSWNILYSTYSGLDERGMELEQANELEEGELGEWILLPKSDDWDLLKRYVNTWFAGMEPDIANLDN